MTYTLSVTQGTNITALSQELKENIQELLVASLTSPPTSAPTSLRRWLQTQNCTVNANLTITAPSQYMTADQIGGILQGASSAALFGNYSSSVCSYDLQEVIITPLTSSPTLAPTSRQCLVACELDYLSERFECTGTGIMPKLQCIMAARQKKKSCRQNALKAFCIF